jgi:YidC/Oxa1 family membrane protein insertase
MLRWTMLAALLIVLVAVIAGCAGPGGGKPLTDQQFLQLGQDMVSIENSSLEEQNAQYESLEEVYNDEEGNSADERAYARLLQGYIVEYQATTTTVSGPQAPKYTNANNLYQEASKLRSPYGMQASYRTAVLGALGHLGPENSTKAAKSSLNILAHNYSTAENTYDLWVRAAEPTRVAYDTFPDTAVAGVGGNATLVPEPGETGEEGPVLQRHEMADTALRQLDTIYATRGGLDTTYYNVIDAIVGFFARLAPGNQSVAVVLMLFLLAVLIKVITAPLTTMAYRGMRDMQRVQPLLKELQAKYKDDRAKLAEEQMKLMKEHKVSPASGCLPMLIQLPIFIAVYRAVTVYAFQFSNAGFLWIENLARPDLILLILYAISMIVTQKLTATPAADPQQQVLQNQMTYMMPVFLVLVLYSMASAFLLYWFFLNVMSSGHQYYLLRKFKAEEAARDAAQPAPAPAPGTPAKRRKKGAQ